MERKKKEEEEWWRDADCEREREIKGSTYVRGGECNTKTDSKEDGVKIMKKRISLGSIL